MTPSTTELDLNLRLPNLCVIAHAVQGDALARVITANLYDGSTPWTPPEGAIGVIKFSTALGTSGMYDTDEDGNTAVTWSGNVATLRIVQNAIAVPGDVPMQLKFYDGNEALSTFRWECLVEPSTMTDTEFLQTDYYNILSQQIAAILEVQANIPTPSTSNPAMDGTAAPGTSTTYSRGDHVHPTDTSRAPTNHAKNDTTYGAASTSNYGHVRLSNTTPSMDGTGAVGSSTDVARANHVHPSDTSRVPTTRKINGLDLSVDRTLTAENIGYDGTLESHTAGSVGKELGDLSGAIREKHIFLMSDSYGVFAASGGESWEGFVRDYLVPQGKTVTMNATGGAGFGYQPSHADYQQCYYPNIIDGYTADSTVDMILILTGANDGNLLFGASTTESVIKAGIASSVSKLRTKFPNASIHLGFVGRYRTSNRFVSYKTARDIYKNACAENGIAFADNFEYILHNRNMINSTDLVHPTLAGSELIGKYAVEYIMRKGISVIYEDVYTIAATNTWFDWTGKKLKVKVCNETTFVTLLSSTNAYEFSFGPIQNIPVGVSVNTNETLTTEQFLLDTSILTDSTLLLFALWLNTDGTTNMTLPSRVAFTQSGIFMTTVKPYAVTYPTGSTLKVINSYTAFDTMLT